jgi:hypothetical protein
VCAVPAVRFIFFSLKNEKKDIASIRAKVDFSFIFVKHNAMLLWRSK